jgi:hypothetical protein
VRPPSAIVGILALLIISAAESAWSQGLRRPAADLTRIIEANETASIVTTDGRRVTGAVEAVSETALLVRMGTQTETVALERLLEVRVRRHDPLWNGVLVGAGVGALAGLVPDYYDDCAECHDPLFGSIAVGAGIGLLVDVLKRGMRLVYRAPNRSPAVSLNGYVSGLRTGAMLRWSF